LLGSGAGTCFLGRDGFDDELKWCCREEKGFETWIIYRMVAMLRLDCYVHISRLCTM
jgi:hypothetical protein